MGWGGGACQRSLYFVHYSLLRCRDLWDRCYVTCYYAAEISGVVAAMTVKRQKTRLRFCKVSNIRNQLGTVVKSRFLDKMCTPMSTVSGPAGCLCTYTVCYILIAYTVHDTCSNELYRYVNSIFHGGTYTNCIKDGCSAGSQVSMTLTTACDYWGGAHPSAFAAGCHRRATFWCEALLPQGLGQQWNRAETNLWALFQMGLSEDGV